MQGDFIFHNDDEEEHRHMFYNNPNIYPDSYPGNMQAPEMQTFGQSEQDALANYYASGMQAMYHQQLPGQFSPDFLPQYPAAYPQNFQGYYG